MLQVNIGIITRKLCYLYYERSSRNKEYYSFKRKRGWMIKNVCYFNK